MTYSKSFDYQFKFIIVGESGTGKSSILIQLVENEFYETEPTIGMSYKNCPFEIEGKKIDLRIWDTAGQERYRSINRSYFQGTCGALLVYDITSIHSFETLPYWIKEIQEYAPENVQMVLVGNKIDLVDDRKVSTEMGEKFANDNQLDICETSAKTAENVRDAFELCIKKVLDSVERGVFKLNEDQIGLRQRVELLKHEENETGKKKKKEGCC